MTTGNDEGALELVAQLSVDLAEIVGERPIPVHAADDSVRYADLLIDGRPVQILEYLDDEVATYTHVRMPPGPDREAVVTALLMQFDIPRDAVVWTE